MNVIYRIMGILPMIAVAAQDGIETVVVRAQGTIDNEAVQMKQKLRQANHGLSGQRGPDSPRNTRPSYYLGSRSRRKLHARSQDSDGAQDDGKSVRRAWR